MKRVSKIFAPLKRGEMRIIGRLEDGTHFGFEFTDSEEASRFGEMLEQLNKQGEPHVEGNQPESNNASACAGETERPS
jgi:hypothetical protein